VLVTLPSRPDTVWTAFPTHSGLGNPIVDYYRCPVNVPEFVTSQSVRPSEGFFCFGSGVVCYGKASGTTRSRVTEKLFDASQHVEFQNGSIILPFDLNQSLNNLRCERYVGREKGNRWIESSWIKNAYYRLRPALPISFRKHLQRVYLSGWETISFPAWPVDRSVDLLFEHLLVLVMKKMQINQLPFIWFWPEGHRACAVVTHDVETAAGRDFSERLMDIDDEYGIKASFQVVPEKRYEASLNYLETIRQRGFEVNVQGLDHEGNLFQDKDSFLRAAERINEYAEQFGALGFRSPVLYRNVDWLQYLNFSYDMSVPNVARLEAQRGGCCTVMPYALPSGMTELPLTTTEDYTLFHILKDPSISLWKEQMSLIRERHGLISFIVHPDYITSYPAQGVYKELLGELVRLRSDEGVWVTLPREVDRWWRQRSQLKLVAAENGWRIEGAGSEHARVAYACLDGERLSYQIEGSRTPTGKS
jgi:hypothetical protein